MLLLSISRCHIVCQCELTSKLSVEFIKKSYVVLTVVFYVMCFVIHTENICPFLSNFASKKFQILVTLPLNIVLAIEELKSLSCSQNLILNIS